MKKTRLSSKGSYRAIILIGLAVFLMSLGSVQAQSLSGRIPNQVRPEIMAQLNEIQGEIERNGYTFTVGYNPAMEYSISQLCGLVEPEGWHEWAPFLRTYIDPASLPTSYDTRTALPGGTTDVRNQGSCGSCWAFGTVAPLEILASVFCGVKADLSEQFLVSCNNSGWSCSGGWFAHEYHQWHTAGKETEPGALLEASFPYTATNATCNGPYGAHPYKINSWSYVLPDNPYSVPAVDAIKGAIYEHGPLSVAVCAGTGFQSYKSGIFNANECTKVNHAVTLVGWKDAQGTDPGHWILKNSWGQGWGESGYMRIAYGVSSVGYAANFIDFGPSNCPGSPSSKGLVCSTATTLKLGNLYSSLTTVGGASNVSTYNLGGKTESGPEKVYTVVTTKTGDLTATLSGMSVSAGLDVFILNSCSANSAVAFGDTSATYAGAPAGTYYVVVDGTGTAGSSFNLQTSLAPALPDLTGAWTQIKSYSSGKTVYGTLQVNNIGTAVTGTGTFKVAYYLSSYIDGKVLGTYLGYQTVNPVAKGSSVTLLPSFTSKTSLTGKYLIAVIDSDSKVTESNENNNKIGGLKIAKATLTK